MLFALWVLLLHDDAKPMQALAEALGRAGIEARLDTAFRDGADAVFMYVHGALDPALETRLIRYTEAGGRLIVLHHGAASGKIAAPRWLPFLGLRIRPDSWKVLRGDVQLVNLNPGHYVTTHGVTYDRKVDYTTQTLDAIHLPGTEFFLNQHFTGGREKTVLFGLRIEVYGRLYMQDRGGWLKPAGKGHIFYFQPGHQAADFQHRGFAQILANAVHWQPGSRH